jgi:hypothetical protein
MSKYNENATLCHPCTVAPTKRAARELPPAHCSTTLDFIIIIIFFFFVFIIINRLLFFFFFKVSFHFLLITNYKSKFGFSMVKVWVFSEDFLSTLVFSSILMVNASGMASFCHKMIF